jgi:hypothetical protein
MGINMGINKRIYKKNNNIKYLFKINSYLCTRKMLASTVDSNVLTDVKPLKVCRLWTKKHRTWVQKGWQRSECRLSAPKACP